MGLNIRDKRPPKRKRAAGRTSRPIQDTCPDPGEEPPIPFIDFDGASKAWRANKMPMDEHGHFEYKDGTRWRALAVSE